MEKLQKELSDLEAKVEAGFLQLYDWQDIDRCETKNLKRLLSEKVDQGVVQRLSESQAECSNQLDELIVQGSLTVRAAPTEALHDLPKKFHLLQADVDVLKSKATQLVPSESPTHIVQTQKFRQDLDTHIAQTLQFRQDLENLINAKSHEVTKKLQQNIGEIKQQLCVAESELNLFKSNDHYQEIELVKTGVYKVINDLKKVLGPVRPQTFSDELDTILGRSNMLSLEIDAVKLSVCRLSEDFLAIKDDKSPENSVGNMINNHRAWCSQQVQLLKSELDNTTSNFMSQVDKSNTLIDNTVKSAVNQFKAQVLESKSDFSNQAKEEISRLGTQNTWDKLAQKLGEVTQDISINATNFQNLSKKLEELSQNKSTNAADFNGWVEHEIESIKSILNQNQQEVATLREQVTISTIDKNSIDKDVAELKNQVELIQTQITSKLEQELKLFKDDLRAMVSEGSWTRQTKFPVDPSLQTIPMQESHSNSNRVGARHCLRDVMRIGSSDNETESTTQLQKGKNNKGKSRQVRDTSTSPTRHCSKAAMKSSRSVMSIGSSSDEPEITGQSQKRQKHSVTFSSTSKSMPTHSDRTTSHTPYSQRSERSSHSNHQSGTTSFRKGRYVNSGKVRKSAEGITPSSIRKDRSKMNAREKDEDENLSNVIQHHIRILTSTRRSKDERLPLASEEYVQDLPELQTKFDNLSIPANAPYLLTKDQVELNIADDAEVQIGFVRFCEQKARLYGLPFVGLALENCSKGCEWNRRTKMFLLDTLLQAITYGQYPEYNLGADSPDSSRIEKLLTSHLKYQLELIERCNKDAQYLESTRKQDRKAGRRSRLCKRRFATCQEDPGLSVYTQLFLDDKLCSSDESMEDPMDEDKIRHIPPWRSRLATLLVNRVDKAYKEILRTEYPKRNGRKPAKRLPPGDNPVVSDPKTWPTELPEDCYDQSWLQGLDPQEKIVLQAQEPMLGGLIDATH